MKATSLGATPACSMALKRQGLLLACPCTDRPSITAFQLIGLPLGSPSKTWTAISVFPHFEYIWINADHRTISITNPFLSAYRWTHFPQLKSSNPSNCWKNANRNNIIGPEAPSCIWWKTSIAHITGIPSHSTKPHTHRIKHFPFFQHSLFFNTVSASLHFKDGLFMSNRRVTILNKSEPKS